ncbi:MAG: diadenylate cyclase CdaA [Sedimentisphaerales bacterium]|nr:diadenylate cyclase CdaA [Sedimentisphaerales bacterium]
MDAIFDYLYSMEPRELLIVCFELLFIGIFVYIILSFLEGTRGERLFRGIIFILLAGKVILNLVVERFDMARVAYLYNWFLFGILIIAIVAFQPEIRRALIRLGQARFLSSSPQQLSRSVEEIIAAVSDLASTKTGAIIVVEQQVGLGEFIETGERIDAKVTAELLRTIFYPGTPLHDMAVVIQADRVVAARVQLPLAESGSFRGGQLGSRHRAAIGVSSSSDAIVIVVSEETGIISIAVDGNLIRNVSEEQLRKRLTTAVVEAGPLIERRSESEVAAPVLKKAKKA